MTRRASQDRLSIGACWECGEDALDLAKEGRAWVCEACRGFLPEAV